MEIAICDDDKLFSRKIKDMLIEYRNNNRFEINIYEFETGETFLQSDRKYDVVFLDYQMPGLDGLETARRLREKNNICSIIFVTSYPEFILDSFAVQPFRFIVKPLDKQKIVEALDAYIKQQKLFYPITIIENCELKTIASQDIVYLEGDGKYCWLYTCNGTFHSSKTLIEAHKLLPHCFYRIHKSYVINMFSVSSMHKNKVVLTNGKQLTISRANISPFKKAYLELQKNSYVRL